MWNIKNAAMICGGILLVLVIGQTLRSVMAQQSTPAAFASAPAESPSTMPTGSTSQPAAATAKYGPAQTPKGTVKSAFHAAAAGDLTAVLSCFDQPKEMEQLILKLMVNHVSAASELQHSVAEKMGIPNTDPIYTQLSGGITEENIASADESITDNQAEVDIHIGPGKIPLVKIGQVWKISPGVLSQIKRSFAGSPDDVAREIRAIAAEVNEGKIKTAQELSLALTTRLKLAPGQ